MRDGPSIAGSEGVRARGFVLLIVLLSVGLLALLTAQLTASGRSDAVIAATLRDAAIADAAAEGGIADAAFLMLTGDERFAAGETVAETIGRARLRLAAPARGPVVNPNADPPVTLAANLRAAGVDPALASRLAEAMRGWHAPGGVRGQDEDAYRRAGLRYGPARSLFGSADEVGLVLGMTPPALALIRPHLELFGGGNVLADSRPGGVGVPGPAGPRIVTVTAVASLGATTASRTATLMLREQPEPDAALFSVLDWTADRQP